MYHCRGLGLQSVLALINTGIQDVPILTPQAQCSNGGDEQLSDILDEIPIPSGDG